MDAPTSTCQHWHYRIDDHKLCRLTIDVAGRSTNVLSREVLEELGSLVQRCRRDQATALLISSAKQNGFIAGADIHSFTRLSSREEALELIRQGQEIFSQLEELPMTTICQIHGFCLGGGLELALACDYRLAADTPATRIGLPEVKLGIHPGFGGTVRLSRLLGGDRALPLMLSGRTLSARQAARAGVITHAVAPRLLQTAVQHLIQTPPSALPNWRCRLVNSSPVRPLVAAMARRKLRQKVREEHYPAPFALLKLWEEYGNKPARMMTQEAASVAELIRSPTARNLIRAFLLQERLKSLPADRSFAPQHIHVIGAGVMGGDIAAWCALKGLRVTLQDTSVEVLARAVKRSHDLFRRKLKTPHLVKAALDRFTPDREGHGLTRAEVVIEAIFEDVTAKQELLRSLEPRLKPSTLLATNTSSIPIETLAAALEDPGRLLGLHFFNPVAKMLLVEVVSTSYTTEEQQHKAIQLTKTIGKLPLPVQSGPGFLVNRILMPYLHEAALMEAEGIAPQLIDQVAEEFGMPVGPIELIDLVGLDICQSVARFMAAEGEEYMPRRLTELIEAGRLGKKSGAGYYEYHAHKALKPTPDPKHAPPKELEERLLLRLLNEGVTCLREGVVDDGDLLDAGMIFATGFAPFRGGLIHYLHDQGAGMLLTRLRRLEQQFGPRFTPDPGWEQLMAA
ncbi:3-hydroxyacyl-CoA dehydrogenase NAD-binding domain-containing protein [Desulfogranum mediterraneum]|uniref:3-hydroxyacyl-CoA dehydrogenase NAD-binding domain-containing protein n=1 Tax=Desulfogranum mediterraneum TaxID=160661 RepID=UPI0003FFA7C0|nr:3-hydroxyacyl-CoA dehydrogenase NAD-binding domain-containing protein [Desulfogranum mediterraneum]